MHKKTILASAGTGKTYFLINEISKLISSSIEPEEIAYVSFTKSAINEAISRITEKENLSLSRFKNFKTIHSACFSNLKLSKVNTLSDEHLEELSSKIGFKLTLQNEYDSIYSLQSGSLALTLNNLARLKMQDEKSLYDELNLDAEYNEIEYISKEYNEFKHKNSLYDFTDMLSRFVKYGEPLPYVKYFYVDEAQDLNLLQWKVVEKMASNCETLTIAGDDDQAIYQWSGADVNYFLNFARNSEKIILNKSYRCKENIRDFSFDIVKKLSDREEKFYEPVAKGGDINFLPDIYSLDMDKGDWKVLVRNNYLQKGVIEYCKDKGYYFTSTTEDFNKIITSLVAYTDLQKGKNISKRVFAKMIDYIIKRPQNLRYILEERICKAEINKDDLQNLDIKEIDLNKNWFDAFKYLDFETINYIKAMLRNKENLRDKPRITIESIHSAKGKEADNVALLLDISKKTFESYHHFPDAELRCLYVACTRAKNSLTLIQPQGRYYYEL